MTLVSPIDSPALPSMLGRLAHDFAQKLLTTAATGLMAHGVLTQTQGAEFAEVGSALALYAASSLWTVVAAWIRSRREKGLLQAYPPLTSPPLVGGGR